MILSDRMRKRYCDQNLTYFDPDYVHLKVGAESTIKEDQVRSMVARNDLDEELRTEQMLRQVSGTISCFLCEGHGSLDELYRAHEEEERQTRTKPTAVRDDDFDYLEVDRKMSMSSNASSETDENL